MTREDLIREVYLKWKPGGVIQFRALDSGDDWDDSDELVDPTRRKFSLDNYEYRLKPRTVRYVIEVSEHCKLDLFKLVAEQISGHGFADEFIEAVRNAKPLAGGVS